MNEKKYRKLKDLSINTHIADAYLDELIKKNHIISNFKNFEQEITEEDYLKVLKDSEYKLFQEKTFLNEYLRLENDERNGNSQMFKKEIEDLSELNKEFIDLITTVHKKYINKINFFKDETPLVASYLLFARAINLLNTINFNLKNQYINSLIYLRPLEEAIQLAKYFLIGNTSKSKFELFEWFKMRKSPHPRIIRETIENFDKQYLSEEQHKEFEGKTYELHNLKSKSIHNSYIDTIVIKKCRITNNLINVCDFDYNACTKPRDILDIVLYLPSQILTVVLDFQFCYEILIKIISTEDIQLINKLREKIMQQSYKNNIRMNEIKSL